jgi:hypothetical protein
MKISGLYSVLSTVLLVMFDFVPATLLMASPDQPQLRAFQPGETLTYEASWSETVKIGTAVMAVNVERLADGREVLRLTSTSRTEGVVGKLYPLGDTVQSIFDPVSMQSLSFSLRETQGKKLRRRVLTFDHVKRQAVVQINDDPLKTFSIPDHVQDNLSSIYYLRTRENFTASKLITFETFDSEQTWTVEVQTVGREKV